MDELNNTIIQAATEIIGLILTLLVTVVIPYGLVLVRSWFKSKIAEAQAKVAAIQNAELRDGINDALKRLDTTADTVVSEIEATLKKRDANGVVMSPDVLRNTAIKRIASRIPPSSMALLKETYGSKLVNIIVGKIEQKTLDKKPLC